MAIDEPGRRAQSSRTVGSPGPRDHMEMTGNRGRGPIADGHPRLRGRWTRARARPGSTCRDDDGTGARRVTRVASAKWCTSGVHRARTLSPAGDRVSLPCLRPCPRPRARVSALGEIARPSTRMDWRVVRGSVDYPGAVLPPDWSTWWYFSGRRGVPGGASQSRVSFLLSVFHCVFKFVIYDPD